MIRKSYPWLLLLAGVTIGFVVSGRLVLLAQDRAGTAKPSPSRSPHASAIEGSRVPLSPPILDEPRLVQPSPGGSSSAPTVQDVLLRPHRFPFSQPTSLLS
jgi:hypothetical protein